MKRRIGAVAAVVVATLAVAAAPANAAAHPPRQRAQPSHLWSQFPLDPSARAKDASTRTTISQRPPPAPVRPPLAQRVGSGEATTFSASVLWIVLAGLVLVVVAGAIGWREMRRSRSELPARAERPRGLDLIVGPQAPVEDEPMAIKPLEGSYDMPEPSRDRPVADANDESARPSYEALGDRIASVLAAAEDAAAQTTLAAAQEAADLRAQADAYSDEVRRSAEAAAAETRAAAEAEAARILSAAEERAKRTDQSAIEHRQNLIAEAQSLQDLIDERRDWLRQITGALRDAAGRLENITENDDATDPISHALTDRRGRSESEYVG